MDDKFHYDAGLIKVNQNLFESALDDFTKAIDMNATNPQYFNQRAVCYLNLGKFELSLFDMNKSIELDAKYAFFYTCRGFLKTKMKDMEGAVSDYEISLELDPDNDITYNNMALALESMGNMNRAQKYYKKSNEALGYNPENRVLNPEETFMVDKKEEASPEDKAKLKEHLQNIKSEQDIASKEKSKKIAKGVFTKKSSFKEFLDFIKNGFKLKEDDKK
jgi:tetratricopeptide (TPR) repeat protein